MSSAFVGCIVSIDCGEVLGMYQGQVTCINNSSQELTITKAFRNGLKCPVSEITLKWVSSNISELKSWFDQKQKCFQITFEMLLCIFFFSVICFSLLFDSASDIKELKIVKNSTEAVSITKKIQQSTPSKLSPENDCLLSGPSPVKIIEKPLSVLSEKQLNDSCNVRNGISKSNQEGLVNGFLKKSSSSPRMTNGNMPRSPINGVNRYAATNGNGYQRYTPPCENGGHNVRYTPTKEEPQRPRRNSGEFGDFIF